MKKAIYSGSFDPFHEGHLSILNKALQLFDEIIVLICKNINKKAKYDFKDRKKIAEKYIKDLKNVKIEINSDKLLATYAKNNNIKYLIRGVRDKKDLNYELEMNYANKNLNSNLETIIFFADDKNRKIASKFIKEIKEFSNKNN